MAERRMFAKTIIDSDLFIDMPTSTRLLYYDLNMRADDDGFVNSPKKIIRMTGASQDDLKLLIAKQFVIPFESGVVVIKHWKIHNYIRKDRYIPTICQEELMQLSENDSKEYVLDGGRPMVDQRLTQVRLGEDRIGKDSVGESKESTPTRTHYGNYRHVLLSTEELKLLNEQYGIIKTGEYIKRVDDYCQAKGKTYKDYFLAIKNWITEDRKDQKPKKNKFNNFEGREYDYDSLERQLLNAREV